MNKNSYISNKRLMVVLAHPDDETFGMGGTLALYARKGTEIHLVCATRGEEGEIDPEFKKDIKSSACLRTQELQCAADILGIYKVHFLNYRDSGMPGAEANFNPKALAAQPVEQVAREVASLMRQIQPDAVITFDPIGGYRHPDHIAMHKATVRAFELSPDDSFNDSRDFVPYQPEFLYFHTINQTFLKVAVWALRLAGKDPHRYGRNQDIDLASLVEIKFPTHVRINYRSVKKVQARASACHASQGGADNGKGVRGLISRVFNGYYDTYMQAYPPPVKKVKRDLFEE